MHRLRGARPGMSRRRTGSARRGEVYARSPAPRHACRGAVLTCRADGSRRDHARSRPAPRRPRRRARQAPAGASRRGRGGAAGAAPRRAAVHAGVRPGRGGDRLAHGEPPLGGPRARSDDDARGGRPGLCRPCVRLAGGLRRPHLARRQAGRRRDLHPLRGDRLVRRRRAPRGGDIRPARAGRRVVRQCRRASSATCAGSAADEVIARLPEAIAAYPYPTTYRAWPGPNSNTFVAHLGRAMPELRLALPSTAIGKDYVPFDRMSARRRATPASSSRCTVSSA